MKTKFLYCFSLFLFCHLLNGQTVDRVEPPNWWIGMKDPGVEIMVYGKGIGNLKPEIKYKGVTLLKTSCPENKDYIFLDLTIKRSAKSGEVPILFLMARHRS